MVTWNEETAGDVQTVLQEQALKDTKLTAYFKANAQYPEAQNLLYQDFPSKFVWIDKKRDWRPRQ